MAASEASLDEPLELKKRARRRLVGATALALLAAIVLPMVMEHEPRPGNQDIQVRIPNPDADGSPAPAPVPMPAAAAAVPSAPEPKVEAKAEAKPEAPPKPAAAAAAPAKAVDKPMEKVVEKAAEKLPERPADKKSDEARAADLLNSADQWVIQLGAYKETGNVKLLLSKLKDMGLPAYTEKFDSPQGPRTRVRAGPFPSKDAAEKARIKVKILGVDGPVAPK